MKNLHKKLSGLIAAVTLVIATGCVTQTTISGTADRHGLLSGYSAADKVTNDGAEIASYNTILGLVDTGHAEYVTKVKAAEAQGKKIRTKTMWYIVITTTTAYAK